MTAATAIIALLISLVSLAFSIYQYRTLHRVRVSEKTTSLLRLAYDLRRKSQDLRHMIDSTDNVDNCTELLGKVNNLLENGISKLATSELISLKALFEIEERLLSLELEIDLLQKQVIEIGKLNEEARVYEAKKLKSNEH